MSISNEPIVGAIIFSLRGDTVWATWPGKGSSVELGDYDAVTYMMRDFIAQCDLGDRLAARGGTEGERA